MKKGIFSILPALLILFFISGCGKEKSKNQNEARVIFSIGDVTAKVDGQWINAAEQMLLQQGSEIKTGDTAQCNLVIGKDSFISLKENSHLVLETLFRDVTGIEKNSVELKVGKSVLNPKKLLKGDEFRIKTPTAIAAVRGTKFVVESNPHGKLKVAVVAGKVQLQRRIPALEKIEEDIVKNSSALSALKEKVSEESIVVDANQSAFIDNLKVEEENKIIEEVVTKHVEEVKKEEKKQTETAADTPGEDIKSDVEKKQEIQKKEEDLTKALAGLVIMKKKKDKTETIKLDEKISKEDVQVVEELETAIKEVKAKEKEEKTEKKEVTKLTIVSPVRKSAIYVNSKLMGYDSVTLTPLHNEKLSIEVKARGYESYSTEVTLKEGENRNVQASLVTGAKLTIASPVRNSRIYVNSRLVGRGTATIQPGSGKKLVIEVKARGFKTFTDEVVLETGEDRKIAASLEKTALLGRVKWTQKFGAAVSATPVYHKNLLIIATNDGNLIVSSREGKRIWKLNLKRRIESTPVARGRDIYVATSSGNFYSINLGSGKIKWKKKLLGSLLFGSKPVIVDNAIYAATSYGQIYAMNRKDGKELWKINIENGIYATPAYRKGTLYVGAEDFNIYAVSAKDGKIDWKFKADSRMVASTPVVRDRTLYVGCYSGSFFAINTRRGKLKWKVRTGGSILSSPLIHNSRLYFGSNDGNLYVLSMDSGKIQWKYRTGDKIVTKPTIVKNMLVVTSGKKVHTVNLKTRRTKWIHEFDRQVKTSATVVGNDIYIGLDNGEIASVRDSLKDIYR